MVTHEPAAPLDSAATAAQLWREDDLIGLMRACHDRRLEREGIPMVVALVDQRGQIPEVREAPQRAEGRAYSRALDRYAHALVPWAEDHDEGALITAMQVLAYTHFAPGALPPEAAATHGTANALQSIMHRTAAADGSPKRGAHLARPAFSLMREQYRKGHFIRVVNYHSTPRAARAELATELARFARDYAPVTLADLDRLFQTGVWHDDRPGLIPVFYEGYRNSVEVAAPLCDEFGLTGWFAIATSFIDAEAEHQEAFARAHWISLVEEDTRGGRIAMSWAEVAELSRRHVVFPHTARHEGFDTVHTEQDLQREVFEPKRQLESVTGQEAAAFVWLHGSSYGQSPMHDAAVRQAGYRYQFSNTMIHRLR